MAQGRTDQTLTSRFDEADYIIPQQFESAYKMGPRLSKFHVLTLVFLSYFVLWTYKVLMQDFKEELTFIDKLSTNFNEFNDSVACIISL